MSYHYMGISNDNIHNIHCRPQIVRWYVILVLEMTQTDLIPIKEKLYIKKTVEPTICDS